MDITKLAEEFEAYFDRDNDAQGQHNEIGAEMMTSQRFRDWASHCGHGARMAAADEEEPTVEVVVANIVVSAFCLGAFLAERRVRQEGV